MLCASCDCSSTHRLTSDIVQMELDRAWCHFQVVLVWHPSAQRVLLRPLALPACCIATLVWKPMLVQFHPLVMEMFVVA